MLCLPIESRKKQLVYEVKTRSRSRQTITYRLHGHRKLLVPSIMLRRDYLRMAHLRQIKSEMHAIQSRHSQLYHRSEAVYHRVKALPNYGHLPQAEHERYEHEMTDDVTAFMDRMDPRMIHLKAMKKKITQFKLN